MKKYSTLLFVLLLPLILLSFNSCDGSLNNTSGNNDSIDQTITDEQLNTIYYTLATFEANPNPGDKFTEDDYDILVTQDDTTLYFETYSITYNKHGIVNRIYYSTDDFRHVTLDGWDINDFCLDTTFPYNSSTCYFDYFKNRSVELNGTYHRDVGDMEYKYRYASDEDDFEIVLNKLSNNQKKFDIIFNFTVTHNYPQASLSINGVDYSAEFEAFLESIYGNAS